VGSIATYKDSFLRLIVAPRSLELTAVCIVEVAFRTVFLVSHEWAVIPISIFINGYTRLPISLVISPRSFIIRDTIRT